MRKNGGEIVIRNGKTKIQVQHDNLLLTKQKPPDRRKDLANQKPPLNQDGLTKKYEKLDQVFIEWLCSIRHTLSNSG